jgi:hypothetical protein
VSAAAGERPTMRLRVYDVPHDQAGELRRAIHDLGFEPVAGDPPDDELGWLMLGEPGYGRAPSSLCCAFTEHRPHEDLADAAHRRRDYGSTCPGCHELPRPDATPASRAGCPAAASHASAALGWRRGPARIILARGQARGVARVVREQMLHAGQLAGQYLVGLHQLRQLPAACRGRGRRQPQPPAARLTRSGILPWY